MKTGKIILIHGVTGSGKGTLIEYLKTVFPHIVYVRSLTTRERRDGVENKSYVFVSTEEFEKHIADNDLIEWTQKNEGRYYGTPKKEIDEGLNAGKILLKEIEAIGLSILMNYLRREQYVLVRVDPVGGWDEVLERIQLRAKITSEEIALRKERYERELREFPVPDYVIHNKTGEVEHAKQEAVTVINTILEKEGIVLQ